MSDFIPIESPHPVLAKIVENGLPEGNPIPIKEILHSSVFYPACGLDADPIRLLSKSIRSFVYCDYAVGRETFTSEINEKGFRGYNMVLSREVSRADLVKEDWKPNFKPTWEDGNITLLRDQLRECQFFSHWSIWRHFESDHWFSLLFLSREACVTYKALYKAYQINPIVLCLIQPGHTLGGNWTNFYEEEGFFHRMVESTGSVKYLMVGGYNDQDFFDTCCWPGYHMIAKPQPMYIPPRYGWGHMLLLMMGREDSNYPDGANKPEEFKGKRLRLWKLDNETAKQC
jgi:hypothetical protein